MCCVSDLFLMRARIHSISQVSRGEKVNVISTFHQPPDSQSIHKIRLPLKINYVCQSTLINSAGAKSGSSKVTRVFVSGLCH